MSCMMNVLILRVHCVSFVCICLVGRNGGFRMCNLPMTTIALLIDDYNYYSFNQMHRCNICSLFVKSCYLFYLANTSFNDHICFCFEFLLFFQIP